MTEFNDPDNQETFPLSFGESRERAISRLDLELWSVRARLDMTTRSAEVTEQEALRLRTLEASLAEDVRRLDAELCNLLQNLADPAFPGNP